MQTTILKKDFINALTIGGAMAGKNKTLPILDSAKVEVTTDTISVHSFNGESWVTKQTKVESADTTFAFCINPNDLVKALKSLAEEVVTFSIEGNLLRIEHFKGTMEMPVVDSTEFPSPSIAVDGIKFDIESSKLKEWLFISSSFVSSDDLIPVMCGMYFYSDEGRVGVCATDAHKLWCDSIDKHCEDFGIVVPSSGIKPLAGLLEGCEGCVITINGNLFSVTMDNAKFHCRLVEGKFPNFKAVIPSNNPIKVDVSKSELQDSINRAQLMTNKSTSLLKLSVRDCSMDIEGNDVEFCKSAKETIKVEKKGDDITIGVKADILSIALSTVKSESFSLLLSKPERPILISEKDDKKVILIMPMMLK